MAPTLTSSTPPPAPRRSVSYRLCFTSSYTDDCRSTQPNCHLVKFADDTVLLSLLSTLNLHHSSVLQDFITWCEGTCLQLNSSKTKEVICDILQQAETVGRGHHYHHPGGACGGGGGIQVLGHNFRQPSEVFCKHCGDSEKVPPETIYAQEAEIVWCE